MFGVPGVVLMVPLVPEVPVVPVVLVVPVVPVVFVEPVVPVVPVVLLPVVCANATPLPKSNVSATAALPALIPSVRRVIEDVVLAS